MFQKLQTYTDNEVERTRQRAAVIDMAPGLKDLHIKKLLLQALQKR